MENNSNNNKALLIIIISAVIMLIAVGSFTYAFFSANVTTTNNLNISANISDEYHPVFAAYSDGDLLVSVTTADMLNTSANTNNTTVADFASENLYVTLIGGGGASNTVATCTFNLKWTNTGESYTPSPNASSAGLKEYTLKIVDDTGATVFAETAVNELPSTLATGLSISSTGLLVTKTYTVTATIYNLNVVQNIYNKAYSTCFALWKDLGVL